MRLVDVDEIKKRYPIMENDFGMVVNERLHNELDKIPTVEAIPLSVIDDIKAEIEKIRSDNYTDYLIRHVCNKILKIIDEKSNGLIVEQEPFDIETYCKEHFMVMVDKDVWEKAEKALKQEPCEDAISRKEVLNQIFYSTDNSGDVVLGSVLRRRIENLPSVKPQKLCTNCQVEEKTGHWFVDERPESDREIICSNCEQPIFRYHKLDFDYRPNYCPNCGARMIEPQESELENPFNDSRFGG